MLDKDIDLFAPLFQDFLARNESSKDVPSSINVAVQVQPKSAISEGSLGLLIY